ncbi:hypothetical protein [Laceyella putida]|uniref:Uncharacterized protein n=1 Tax=Laceyella putida TaxID=110101 RepID=A0ABW2RR34_9BACL
MKKKVLKLYSFLLCLTGAFVLNTSAAHADSYFETEDGAWDGSITISVDFYDVVVGIRDLSSIPSGYRVSGEDIVVRLCNSSTGNCTAYKNVTANSAGYYDAIFTSMKPGTYRLDVKDTLSYYRVKGYSSLNTLGD